MPFGTAQILRGTMKNDRIVIIKGRRYDSVTGLPLSDTPKPASAPTAIQNLSHKSAIVMKTAQKPINHGIMLARKVGRTMDVARVKGISRFAPKPTAKPNQPAAISPKPDIGPVKHPLIDKVEKNRGTMRPLTQKAANAKSLQERKEETIATALKRADDAPKSQHPKKSPFKYMNVFTVSIIAVIIIGYLVYLYMPGFSVRVASARAGISATYPEYCPDGYSLSGPVTYDDKEVIINFHANTGNSKFTIKQSKSSWDSSAVRAQADKDSGNKVTTTSEKGLTIFSYNNTAAWVNGGILYTITGDAPLSGDQIRRIATSL